MSNQLYRGEGAVFFPYVPGVDKLLGDALKALGHKGSRRPGECTFASADMEHATEYSGGPDGRLLAVFPQDGAVVSWVPGSRDLVLGFASWLRKASRREVTGLPRNSLSFLRDVAGDIDTLDTYLSLRRKTRLASELARAYVGTLAVMEATVKDGRLPAELDGHQGEVWITGPCLTEPLAAAVPAP